MAAQDRTTDNSVNKMLSEEGWRFSFFQIVQLLERYFRPAARVGYQGPASEEIIRFRPLASLSFPVSDVASVEISEDDENKPRINVTTTFLGLYGTTTPLPIFYTEEILWSDKENSQVRAFMDIFHHRLLSLFYRCWIKYRYHTQFEKEGKDDFSKRMLGLIGLGTPGHIENAGLSAVRLIRFSGMMSQRSRSASALEGILSDFFDDVPIHIEQCTGRWVTIKQEQRISLGLNNCILGIDCSVGEKVYGRSGSFRIVLGPVRYETFVSFLPDGERFRILDSIVKLFLKDALDFDIKLLLSGGEIPGLKLISDSQTKLGQRKLGQTKLGQTKLGWTCWLISNPSEGLEDQSLVFKPAEMKMATVTH